MFFVIAKVVFALIAPSNFCLLLIGAGTVLSFRSGWGRLAQRLIIAGFGLLLIFGFSPLARWIAAPLEARFAGVTLPAKQAITHIIVLGGFEQAALSNSRGRLATNAAGERLLALPVLARRYDQAKVVFSGGDGRLFGDKSDAAKLIFDYLVGAGIPRSRIVVEGKSRNTWENAMLVRQALGGDGAGCACGFLLVTSAWHMPRAMGVFEQVGFIGKERRLYAWPVDFRTRGGAWDWRPFRWLHDGLEQSDLAVKEWIGLVVYWLSGRTSEFLPGQPKAGLRKRQV